jgi:multidrug efflux system outer membrane protein
MTIPLVRTYRPTYMLIASMLLAGCSLAPTYDRPEAPIPDKWLQLGVVPNQVSAATTLSWERFVTDEQLRQLINVALTNNRDLRQALLNVELARSQYRVQRADRFPQVDAQASGSRQRTPADISTTGRKEVQESYQVGTGLASFEVDLFGRVRNLSQAALEEYLATDEAARSVRITLISEVIQSYLRRESARQRHLLTLQTLGLRESALDLIVRRQRSGTVAALDYQEAFGLAEQARVDLERIDRELRQASNALSLLVGVSDVRSLLSKDLSKKTLLVQDISSGTPSELLTNRPDIRAVEHQLLSRNASIGAARAAFFPRITLTGMYGSSSSELSDLFSSGQGTWSFSPQITLPIFDGGRNQSNLDIAKIRKDIAIAEYEKTIQRAFREVSDALAATDTLRREEASQRLLVQSSHEALLLAQARYLAGVDDHLRYLDAQRTDFFNQTAQIEVSTQRQAALTTLFKALGGGWQSEQALSLAPMQQEK